MRPFSIRARLTIWYAAVLLAGMVLFGWVLSTTLERRLVRDVDAQLVQRIDGLKVLTGIEGESISRLAEELHEFEREIPNGSLFEVRDSTGVLLLQGKDEPRLPNAVWDALEPVTLEWRGEQIRALARIYRERNADFTAAVAIPLQNVSATMRVLRNLLYTTIPFVVFIALFGGYWISGRALAPVDEITKAARSISEHNLSSRLPVPRTADELQRLSETWNDVLARLETAITRIRRFTADASHELRTPVALIRTTAELALRHDRDSDSYKQTLREIRDYTEQMTQLIESLLALARLDATKGDLTLAVRDLNEIVSEVADEMQTLADVRGVKWKVGILETPAPARVNSEGLHRLLVAVADNALKFTPAGAKAGIILSEKADGYVISVHDAGPGIRQDEISHIFERFYRGTADRSGSGSGLGLSIAQELAQAHGTSIQVESSPGSGSTFFVAFARM